MGEVGHHARTFYLRQRVFELDESTFYLRRRVFEPDESTFYLR